MCRQTAKTLHWEQAPQGRLSLNAAAVTSVNQNEWMYRQKTYGRRLKD